MNVLLTMVDVIRYVSTQYLVTGVTVMMSTYSLDNEKIISANCSEGVCVCLDGFVDDRASRDQSSSGSGNTVDCVGKLKYVLFLLSS